MASGGHPLITFALFAFNQEQFIREAVSGALAQTYSPLQVILSDDCSRDRTFDIMQEMAAAYTGPHQLVLNRNATNMGLGAHVNRIIELAEGELIVAAAGDDISAPRRTSVLARTWIDGNKPQVICSGFTRFDGVSSASALNEPMTSLPSWLHEVESTDAGVHQSVLMKFLRMQLPGLYGAAACWTCESFRRYGPLRSDVWYEDRAIFLRALLDKSLSYCSESLVSYRSHPASMTNFQYVSPRSYREVQAAENHSAARAARQLGHLRQHLHDLSTACELRLIEPSTRDLLCKELSRKIDIDGARSRWWDSNLRERWTTLYPQVLRVGTADEIQWARNRLLPLQTYYTLRKLKRLVTRC